MINWSIDTSAEISPQSRAILAEIATIPASRTGQIMRVATILDVQDRVVELIAEIGNFDTFADQIDTLPWPMSKLEISMLIEKDLPKRLTDAYRRKFIDWIGWYLQDVRGERASSLPVKRLSGNSSDGDLTIRLTRQLEEEIGSKLGQLGVEIRHALQKNNNAEQVVWEQLSQNFWTLDVIGRFLQELYIKHPPKKSLKAGDDSDGFMMSEDDEDDDFKTWNGGVDTLTQEKNEESEVYFYHIQTLMYILDWMYSYMESVFCLININWTNPQKVLKEHEQCLNHLRTLVIPELKKLYIYITEYRPYQAIANFDTFGISSLTTIFGVWEQLNVAQNYFKSE